MLAVALSAALAAGCGGGDDDSDAGGAPTEISEDGSIHIRAAPGGEPAFLAESIAAPAGSVSFLLDNPSRTEHDLVIEDSEGTELARTQPVAKGTTALTATLEPGDYTFCCSVDGHREAGMEGPLTVE
jgi:plastocyanin